MNQKDDTFIKNCKLKFTNLLEEVNKIKLENSIILSSIWKVFDLYKNENNFIQNVGYAKKFLTKEMLDYYERQAHIKFDRSLNPYCSKESINNYISRVIVNYDNYPSMDISYTLNFDTFDILGLEKNTYYKEKNLKLYLFIFEHMFNSLENNKENYWVTIYGTLKSIMFQAVRLRR